MSREVICRQKWLQALAQSDRYLWEEVLRTRVERLDLQADPLRQKTSWERMGWLEDLLHLFPHLPS